jgi:hypothetical protein
MDAPPGLLNRRGVESEYQVIVDLLRSCRYGKHQMCDPEGNVVDISVV